MGSITHLTWYRSIRTAMVDLSDTDGEPDDGVECCGAPVLDRDVSLLRSERKWSQLSTVRVSCVTCQTSLFVDQAYTRTLSINAHYPCTWLQR